ncbi:hypothetical protein BV25DRAFT_1571726 [Artomyces pyxidatus]|uniref:Uncharacterized protein n=1 Tax=Artomyces pyxidatus TaxID=48021 RepID=A0ACB8SJR8_9AGAM|nr:hypothetical protein BV25DRAFT_1571726 [Artomyces pyxidatus]
MALSYSQFLDFLVATPSLEEMLLAEGFPQIPQHQQDARIATMPRLSRVSLTGSSPDVIAILQDVVLPPQLVLFLYCDSDDDTFTELIASLNTIPHRFSNATLPPFSLEITEGIDGTSVDLKSWESDEMQGTHSVRFDDSVRAPALNIHFEASSLDPSDVFLALQEARDVLSLVEVRELVLGVDDPGEHAWSAGMWLDSFRAFHAVQILQVTHTDATNALFDALAEVGNTLFPDLHTLHISKVHLVRIYPARGSLSFFSTFKAVLEERKAQGRGLLTLYISRCEIWRRWVQDIDDVVPEVKWDGIEEGLAPDVHQGVDWAELRARLGWGST